MDVNNSELRQHRQQRERKRHLLENKRLGNDDYFVVVASSSHPLLLIEPARYKQTVGSAVEGNNWNERFIVVYLHCR